MNHPSPRAHAPPLPPEERRAYVRIRKGVHVTVTVIGEVCEDWKERTRNLGVGGLLLVTRKLLRPGTRLQIRARIESAGVDFITGGRVVWSWFNAGAGQYEAGVCFVGLDPVQRRNVMALIGTHLHMMEGLERRHYIRLQRRLLVEYHLPHKLLGRWHTAFASNISLGGVALVVQEKTKQAAHLDLRIHLDDEPDHPITARGLVVGSRPVKGVQGGWLLNVQFSKLPEKSGARLGAFISKILTAPSIQSVTAPIRHHRKT